MVFPSTLRLGQLPVVTDQGARLAAYRTQLTAPTPQAVASADFGFLVCSARLAVAACAQSSIFIPSRGFAADALRALNDFLGDGVQVERDSTASFVHVHFRQPKSRTRFAHWSSDQSAQQMLPAYARFAAGMRVVTELAGGADLISETLVGSAICMRGVVEDLLRVDELQHRQLDAAHFFTNRATGMNKVISLVVG